LSWLEKSKAPSRSSGAGGREEIEL